MASLPSLNPIHDMLHPLCCNTIGIYYSLSRIEGLFKVGSFTFIDPIAVHGTMWLCREVIRQYLEDKNTGTSLQDSVVVLLSHSKNKLPPGQSWINRILRWNIDHLGIVPENPKVDLDSWQLTVEGEIENPKVISWKELLTLPVHESVSDFHCVEGWSVADCRWCGVRFKDLTELVRPKPNTKSVFFSCMDGYTTSLELTDLLEDDVVLAYKLNGQYLDGTVGAPLRLVVPKKYAYKSAMYVEKITFMKSRRLGYWEERGYSDTADAWKDDRRAR